MRSFDEWFDENCDVSDLAKDACCKLWDEFSDQINIICRKSYEKQQSKVDELKLQVAEMKSRLNDAYTAGQSAMYAARQSKVDELQKQVDALTLALDQIAYPIPHMQKEAELNGCELNGYWAVKMSEDHTYSKDIARRALEKEQALKGG